MKLNFESVKILNNKEIQEQNLNETIEISTIHTHNTYIYNLEGFFYFSSSSFSFTTTTITTTTFILRQLAVDLVICTVKYGIKSQFKLLRHVQLIYYILFGVVSPFTLYCFYRNILFVSTGLRIFPKKNYIFL